MTFFIFFTITRLAIMDATCPLFIGEWIITWKLKTVNNSILSLRNLELQLEHTDLRPYSVYLRKIV